MQVLLYPMMSLLELPAVRERVHRVSVDEYHRAGENGVLSEDVELLRGLLVTKMPKSPLHEFVAQKITDMLLANVPPDFSVRVERPLTLSDSEPEPDISVVRGKAEDWLRAHPSSAALVIEVAIRSVAVDESKAEIYAEAASPEFWLVRPEERVIEVFRSPVREGYSSRRRVRASDTLRCEALGLEFLVGDILPRA